MTDRDASMPRVPAPTEARFEREFRAPARPAVLTGLFDEAALREALSLSRLRGAARAAAPVARVASGALVVDPARGIVQSPLALEDFAEALASGAGRGYLMARADELPPPLRRALAEPRYCASAPWRVSKLWAASEDTTSPMHRDLADNLHTVVFGEKVFTLVSPDQSDRVYPQGLRAGLPNAARFDIDRPDYVRFPRARGVRRVTATVGPGETVFIPRGWWHHVRTARGSVSINTWWARGARVTVVALADWFKRARGLSR